MSDILNASAAYVTPAGHMKAAAWSSDLLFAVTSWLVRPK